MRKTMMLLSTGNSSQQKWLAKRLRTISNCFVTELAYSSRRKER
jgi:hypothetical protein